MKQISLVAISIVHNIENLNQPCNFTIRAVHFASANGKPLEMDSIHSPRIKDSLQIPNIVYNMVYAHWCLDVQIQEDATYTSC